MELLIEDSIIISTVEKPLPKNNEQLIQEVIELLINNGVPIIEIDNLLVTIIKMSDKRKMRTHLIDKQDKCGVCGRKTKTLEIHHIKPQKGYPELKYELNNVMLLCKECHDVVHNTHIEHSSSILKRVIQTNIN